MTIAAERPVSTTGALSNELENLIEESINAMSPKELRSWSKDSDKIMADSTRRMDARRAAHGTDR
jgi:hypothetical protein